MHTGHADKILLRIALTDGEVVEGFLVSVAPDHLYIREGGQPKRCIADDTIASIQLGQPSALREFVPVAGVIVGATAGVVALYQVPWLRSHMPQIAGGLAIVGLVGLRELKRRTRLGGWLTSWRELP